MSRRRLFDFPMLPGTEAASGGTPPLLWLKPLTRLRYWGIVFSLFRCFPYPTHLILLFHLLNARGSADRRLARLGEGK